MAKAAGEPGIPATGTAEARKQEPECDKILNTREIIFHNSAGPYKSVSLEQF